jgi:GNAT superfamily N-acetyltransferase
MSHVPSLQSIRDICGRYGLLAGMCSAAYRLLRKTVGFRAMNLVNLNFSGSPAASVAGYDIRALTADEILRFASNPNNDLDASLGRRLASGLDLCFAALLDNQPVSYSWFSLNSIEAEHSSEIAASFPDNVAYFYKSYTQPEHRGCGLHQAVVRQALNCLVDRNIGHVFGFVEAGNWPSLRSCEQIGFRKQGLFLSIGNCRSRAIWLSPQIRELGIRFGADAKVLLRAS